MHTITQYFRHLVDLRAAPTVAIMAQSTLAWLLGRPDQNWPSIQYKQLHAVIDAQLGRPLSLIESRLLRLRVELLSAASTQMNQEHSAQMDRMFRQFMTLVWSVNFIIWLIIAIR